jgi:ATP-dependent DNA helicase RecQ
VDAQKVLSHITRLNKAGKYFMFTHTANILLGKSDDFTDLSTFGIMKGGTHRYIRQLTNRLTALGYIHDDGYLSVTPKANEVLFGGVNIAIRAIRDKKPEPSSKRDRAIRQISQSIGQKYTFSEDLFAKLKDLRLTIAREENVPAFVVFSDATLVDMCQKHPYTEEELLSVSGVGQVKLERYGERFLQLLCGEERKTVSREKPPELTTEVFLQEVEIEDNPLQISRVADNINAVLLKYGRPTISGMKLNKLLLEAGLIETIDGVKLPTDSGQELGITTIQRNSERGSYVQCLFGADAQRFCVRLLMEDR